MPGLRRRRRRLPMNSACTSGRLTDWYNSHSNSDPTFVFWNGRAADGKSILDLLTLGAGFGADRRSDRARLRGSAAPSELVESLPRSQRWA